MVEIKSVSLVPGEKTSMSGNAIGSGRRWLTAVRPYARSPSKPQARVSFTTTPKVALLVVVR